MDSSEKTEKYMTNIDSYKHNYKMRFLKEKLKK